MIFESFAPSLALQDYVEAYHIRHFVFPAGAVLPFKFYHGQPEQCLSFDIRDPETTEYIAENKKIVRPRSTITGIHTMPVHRHIGSDFLKLIVNLQPGVLYRLTGIPIHELTNEGIDAESIFSREIRAVNSRLNSTATYSEMIEIVETFMLQQINRLTNKINSIDHISRLILRHPEKVSLTRLASQANLCPRQFERKFNEQVGIGPKLFARIARFNMASNLKYLNPSADWLSIALATGYHDYPHLVRDCKQFAATTPTDFFLQVIDAPELHFEFMKPEKYITV